MTALREIMRDPRRSQRGSVLSGVLIIMAFIAIIAGALMTELSTNFILSRDLLNRSTNEATVDSAMELALNQMETNPIPSGCPSTTQATLNNRTAVVNFTSCWPSYRERSYNPIATGGAFTADGSHSVIPTASPAQDLYMVGDSNGNLYDFPFGGSSPNWRITLPGRVAAAPITVQDFGPNQNGADLLTLVPLDVGSTPPSGCQTAGCVAMLASDLPGPPDAQCFMGASDLVTTPVAMGRNYPTVAFFGDRQGAIFAYYASEHTGCVQYATSAGTGKAVTAGPFVFAGPTGGNAPVDEIYLVNSGSVLHYTYLDEPNEPAELLLASTLNLPQSGAVGAALEKGTLPARLAISFSDGHVAMVQLSSNFTMSLLANLLMPSSLQAAPAWCHCQSPSDQIGVGGADGAFYVLDPSLNVLASMPAGGPALVTTPATDAVGEWYFGASDGYVYELQRSSNHLAQVDRFGPLGGAINTAIQVAPCANEICMYAASQGGGAYRVPLDARDAVISACISTSAPTCSGANPRLWSSVEVGREGFPNEVHVLGWTYYSA